MRRGGSCGGEPQTRHRDVVDVLRATCREASSSPRGKADSHSAPRVAHSPGRDGEAGERRQALLGVRHPRARPRRGQVGEAGRGHEGDGAGHARRPNRDVPVGARHDLPRAHAGRVERAGDSGGGHRAGDERKKHIERGVGVRATQTRRPGQGGPRLLGGAGGGHPAPRGSLPQGGRREHPLVVRDPPQGPPRGQSPGGMARGKDGRGGNPARG